MLKNSHFASHSNDIRGSKWHAWPTGNPGSVIVPECGSSKITVFVWGKNTILKFLGNTNNETYSAVSCCSPECSNQVSW